MNIEATPATPDVALRLPAKNPCGTCPYRTDTPAGLWAASEYEKLPRYDRETPLQPVRLFACHQMDGRICAGWAGCHDMGESLARRVAAISGDLSPDDAAALATYSTSVDLFPSGRAAADHGISGIEHPTPAAARAYTKLTAQRARHSPDPAAQGDTE